MAKRVFKSKKKLGGRSLYRKWGDWEEGDLIIGKFVGTKLDQYKKDNFMFEVYDAQFADKKFAKPLIDKVLSLNTCGSLANQMENVEEGEVLQVVYMGTSEIKKGTHKGKDAHVVECTIMEEEDGEDDDDSDDEDEDEDDDDEEEDDEDDL